jgi:hypothetical protein
MALRSRQSRAFVGGNETNVRRNRFLRFRPI